jgi:predicted metal-binding membrane protein
MGIAGLFAMWTAMMAAMMLPGALPAILRERGTTRRVAFTAAYLGAWTVFSAVAAIAQFVLERHELLSENLALRSSLAAGAVVLVAAIYQLTPWKRRFLLDCRAHSAPREKPATGNALLAGARYGISCLGSSALLMLLLFVAGVMNVAAMIALALLVAIEKTARAGGRIAGVPFD